MKIRESYSVSKHGGSSQSDDAVVITDDFAAVIDGATSKTSKGRSNPGGGAIAARLLVSEIRRLNPQCTAREVVDALTRRIHEYYQEHNMVELVKIEPVHRLTASIAIFSSYCREVWIVGDCQCMIDDDKFSNTKAIDHILSSVRAIILTNELRHGRSVQELRQKDVGREFIMPLLIKQYDFQNTGKAGEFDYGAIDGFAVPHDLVQRIVVPRDASTVVLATDGYPELRPSLHEAETQLADLLARDPLLIGSPKSTKGVGINQISFDDRSYVRLLL